MTALQHQIRRAQHRLWLNRWGHQLSCCVALAAAAFAIVVLVQRLFDVPIPLFWIGLGLGGGALIASVIWMMVTRESAAHAAAVLDEAAGLRERLSSGHFCSDSDDPFARAVVVDAERVSAAVTVRRHIPLSLPRPIPWTTGAVVLAAMMFLITPGLLLSSEASEEHLQSELAEQTKAVVKQKIDAVRQLAEDNPVLEDLKEDLNRLDEQSGGLLKRPADIRHEAVKKIDKLADAVKKKRNSDDYDKVNAMRRMMRRLNVPQTSTAPTQKLSRALQQGDFKTAKEEIQALREQLATLKSEEDKELVVKLSQKLDELSKQLEKMSVDKKLAQELEQAGVKKEDLERMLENLSKKDLDQLKQQLQEKGLNQQQIDKLTKQLQMQQQGMKGSQQLAKGMKQAAAAASAGQMVEAAAGLAAASDQLSELEQLEQEMAQLDSTLAGLQDAKDDLSNPCSACKGTGMLGGQPCGKCGRKGRGMGKLGQGRGGLAPEQQTDVGFKTERAKVHTGKGAIIGQFLVDGEQVKGEVSSSLEEIVTAAEHDASERINRNRIPRQYQKAVKAYFSNVQRKVQDDGAVLESSDEAQGGESD